MSSQEYYTVDLVIFAYLDFREFVILGLSTKSRIHELSISIISSAIIIIISCDSQIREFVLLAKIKTSRISISRLCSILYSIHFISNMWCINNQMEARGFNCACNRGSRKEIGADFSQTLGDVCGNKPIDQSITVDGSPGDYRAIRLRSVKCKSDQD